MPKRMSSKVFLLWVFFGQLWICEPRRLPPPLAISLPGFGGGNDGDARRREKPPPPPPPGGTRRQEQRPGPDVDPTNAARKQPPPPPRLPEGGRAAEGATAQEKNRHASEETIDYGTQQRQQQQQQQIPPPFWGGNPFFPHPPPTGWLPPHNQEQPPPSQWATEPIANPYEGKLNDFEVLRRELDDCLAREGDLLGQIENLTTSVSTFVQREDLHMRQLDVLTERVIDAEALVASERNALLEYQANCTELERLIASMQSEMADWEAKCGNLTEQHHLDLEALEDMKRIVAQRERETEDLATVIETARLEDEQDRLLVERRKRKRRGFFAWLFGLGEEEDEEDQLREARELAKNTLLRALQNERNSVHELEAALTTLQLNNSAISEMVQSRDTLIQELNDRVAVFEEDKLVLKAALRQLQKEMKEEAPKTQQLIDDLRDSREEIARLNAEMKEVFAGHQDEIEEMEDLLLQKQTAINQTESNLTVIGTYVDKLEERLASFAIARRDIQVREEKCEAIEERAIEMEKERDEMIKRVDSFEVEHDELKTLLGELVSERTKLQQEKVALEAEKDGLLEEGRQLRSTIESLEVDFDGLGGTINQWKEKVFELERRLQTQQGELEIYATKETERNAVNEERAELATKIAALDRERLLLEDERNGLDAARDSLESERLRVDALKMELHFEKQRLASMARPPPPPLPSGSIAAERTAGKTQCDVDADPSVIRDVENNSTSVDVITNATEVGEESESDSEIDADDEAEIEAELVGATASSTPPDAVNLTQLEEGAKKGEESTVEATMMAVSPQSNAIEPPPPPPDSPPVPKSTIDSTSTSNSILDTIDAEFHTLPPPDLPPTKTSSRPLDETIESPPPLPKKPLVTKAVANDSKRNTSVPEFPPLPPPDLPPTKSTSRPLIDIVESSPPLPDRPLLVKKAVNATSTNDSNQTDTDHELPPLPPPELPPTKTSSRQQLNETKPLQPRKPPSRNRPRRKVFLRGVRKALSKATGLHGLLTPSTRQLAAKRRPKGLKLPVGKDKRAVKIPAKDSAKPDAKFPQAADKPNPRNAKPKPAKKRENARFNFFSGKR